MDNAIEEVSCVLFTLRKADAVTTKSADYTWKQKEIELKRFSDTTESLEYGQEFLRFRKREDF